MVDGLDQSDASDLKKIVQILPSAGKTLDNAENQPQIPIDQHFPRFLISLVRAPEKNLLFFIAQRLQPCGVDAADFYFVIVQAFSSFSSRRRRQLP